MYYNYYNYYFGELDHYEKYLHTLSTISDPTYKLPHSTKSSIDTTLTKKIKKDNSMEVQEKKKILNPKPKYSILVTNDGKLIYGAEIKAILGSDKEKSLASILKTSSKEEDDGNEIIHTYIAYNGQKFIQISDDNKWLKGTKKTVSLDSYPESLREGIIKSLNEVKGIYKDNPYKPIPEYIFEDKESMLSMKPVLDEIKDTYQLMLKEIEEEKKKYGNVGLDDFIQRYAFRKHIMILGPKGGGKTYTVSKFCEENGYHTEFIAGHNGLEAIDLLGYYVKDTSGSLVWMDGPLTAAFRKARFEKAVLFVDEILRIPSRELNILIGALTPNSSGNYMLRTNRIVDVKDGQGVSETLIVPQENLWVVSTTNIGADYDTEDMDLALQDRFRMYEMKISDDTVRQIVESCNEKHSENTINKLMKFYSTINALVKAKELTYELNTRHLCEIVQLCNEPKEIKSYLYDLIPNVCSRTTDGNINEVEENIYKKTVNSIFK